MLRDRKTHSGSDRIRASARVVSHSDWIGKRTRRRLASGLMAAACTLATSGFDHAVAGSRNMPNFMQIRILNNETDYDLYPVLTVGAHDKDEYLRAWFDVPENAPDKQYASKLTYRGYLHVGEMDPKNPQDMKGIPPGGRAIIRVPFFTQLVRAGQIDPNAQDQFINWWSGGRVEIFYAPKGAPPPLELQKFINGTLRTKQAPIDPTTLPARAKLPQCQTQLAGGCGLKLFSDPDGMFPNNTQSQFVEYTLGALIHPTDKSKPAILDGYYGAIDIDSSYVDIAFLPVALAPFNSKWPTIAQAGYIGSPQAIDTFRKGVQDFLKPGQPGEGWPQFKAIKFNDKDPDKPILKLASTIHALSPIDPLLMPPPNGQKLWTPIQAISDHITGCVKGTIDPTFTVCQDVKAVWDLIDANYKNYKKTYETSGVCDTKNFPNPVDQSDDLMVFQFVGFTPWTQHCPANFNTLPTTPGYTGKTKPNYTSVKLQFDELQYWNEKPWVFNPWVDLIHARLDIPNSYAYSVDDEMGNFQADGTGFYIAIGGTRGLPNPNLATPPINVNFSYETKNGNQVIGRFTKFGICSDDPTLDTNPDSPSFALYVPFNKLTDCTISFKADLVGKPSKIYTFKLALSPIKVNPRTNAPIIDPATGKPEQQWAWVDNPADADATKPKFHIAINCDGLTDPKIVEWCTKLNYAFATLRRADDGNIIRGPDVYNVQVGGLGLEQN